MVFWIFCRCAICSSATPANVALQYNLDVIIDATSFSMELLERNGRIEAILLSARNVVWQRLLMCCFIDSLWSRCTPRYITVVWKGMQLPSISAKSQPTELICTDEPTSIITSNHQPQQIVSYHLGMTQTKTVLILRFQKSHKSS